MEQEEIQKTTQEETIIPYPSKKPMLGKIIRELMQKDGSETATELARRLLLPQPTIHRLVTGETEDPRLSTLKCLAQHFKVSIDQLAGLMPVDQPHRVTSVPLLDWSSALEPYVAVQNARGLDNTKWIHTARSIQHGFALRTRAVEAPRFERNTLLIADLKRRPISENWVLIRFDRAQEVALRQYFDDGATIRLVAADKTVPLQVLERNRFHFIAVVLDAVEELA